jgi:hypothetical protein
MTESALPERCPICGSGSSVREKLVLVDEAWIPEANVDPRLAHFASLRVDDVKPENVKGQPLEQFVDGYFCDVCGKGFVSEKILEPIRRFYYR